jgi:hypothetical protein
LCCLLFFDLQILIIPLLSSNSSSIPGIFLKVHCYLVWHNIYDQLSVFLYNAQDVICWCLVHIHMCYMHFEKSLVTVIFKRHMLLVLYQLLWFGQHSTGYYNILLVCIVYNWKHALIRFKFTYKYN